jgi:hypothetical protein
VSQRTFGDVDALEAFTAAALAIVADLRAAVADYRRALRELVGAPSDLPVEVVDRTGEADDLVELLTGIDQLPAAFAFALRELDINRFEFSSMLGAGMSNDRRRLEALAFARVEHPHAPPAQLRAIAAGHDAGGDGDAGGGGAAGGSFQPGDHWLDASLNAAGAGLSRVADEYTAAAGAAAAAAAATDRGALHEARRSAHIAKVARAAEHGSSIAGGVLAGLEQRLEDADDHNLTEGQRHVRMATTGVIDGTAGAIGATAGAAVGGPLTVSPAGAVGGAVVGGELGANAGGAIRRSGPVTAVTDRVARSYDRRKGTGHRDDYTERLDLRTRW